MGGETEAAWRAVLDDLLARGLAKPELVIVDGGKGLEAALASLIESMRAAEPNRLARSILAIRWWRSSLPEADLRFFAFIRSQARHTPTRSSQASSTLSSRYTVSRLLDSKTISRQSIGSRISLPDT